MLAVRIDSVENPPWGVAGGMNGRRRARGRQSRTRRTSACWRRFRTATCCAAGDILRLETGGGGGRGHPVRPPRRSRAARRARRLCLGRGGRARIRRRDPRRRARRWRATEARRRVRPAAGAFHRTEYVDALCLTRSLRSPSISAAPSPTSPCRTRRPAGPGGRRRRACRPIRARPSWPACSSRSPRRGRRPQPIGRVLHGTTVATNLILEGKGAPTALITTAGFRHVLDIGRQDIPRRANLYAWRKPRRPVPASHVLEVTERIGAGRRGAHPARRGERRGGGGGVPALGVHAVAICLLHSFANPAHERRVAELAARGAARRRGHRLGRCAAGGARIRAHARDHPECRRDARRLHLCAPAGRAPRGGRHRRAAAADAVEWRRRGRRDDPARAGGHRAFRPGGGRGRRAGGGGGVPGSPT